MAKAIEVGQLFDEDYARAYDEALRELINNHRVEFISIINNRLEERGLDPLDERLL